MDFIDKILNAMITPIANGIGTLITTIVSHTWLAILVWVVLMNIIGYVLMKRDKQYAIEEKRRVRENTLLATAAVGGSIGIYAGMYHFHHKTLHQKFTILVPIIILFQVTMVVYKIFSYIW